MPRDRVVQIDSNTLEILKIWDSVALAEKELNISIYDAVNNYSRMSNNSHWIYENNFDVNTYKENIMLSRNYVCQISIERKLIHIWKNAKQASDNLGLSQGNISMCCIGLRETTNNNYWCYYRDYISDNFPIKEKDTNKKRVIQFNDEGEILKIWDSMTEASNSLKIQLRDISESCNDHKHAGGYLWRLYDDYKGEEVSYTNRKQTRVEKLDNDKKGICIYESIGDAARDVGVKYPGICRAIKNNCKSGGFYWRKVV